MSIPYLGSGSLSSHGFPNLHFHHTLQEDSVDI
jgi:hypothetical protein